MIRLPRLDVLDWIAVALLTTGAVFVATGLLPAAEAGAVIRRITPTLLFLASVVVLAELTAKAQVFDVIATRIAVTARGDYGRLFLLCVGFASLTTIVLNLDTTAVLLTPVMLALARTVGIAAVPLAMTTVWLANTASLLLPVSNLTNLLAQQRIGLDPLEFAARMWSAALVSIPITMLFLWIFYWRRGRRGVDRYELPPAHRVRDHTLFTVAAVACVLFVVAVLVADVPLWVASGSCAVIVVAAFLVRDREPLRAALFPWRLLVFVTGLFLVIETASRHGLSTLMLQAMGSSDDIVGMYRAAFTGAGFANLVNNLPAYVAGEAAVPVADHHQLLALLIGTNIGPLITPWASLATLIWYERCRADGVDVPVARFALTGTLLAVCALAGTTAVLAL